MVFGHPPEVIYGIVLVVSAVLTIVYFFFSDVLDGVLDAVDHPLFSPQLILSFFIVSSAVGLLAEWYTDWASSLILWLGIGVALVAVLLLHFFVFLPLRSAEASLGYTDAELEGSLAKVIVPVPPDGFGEILISRKSGAVAKAAKSLRHEEIAAGEEVVIVQMENGVAVVAKHDPYHVSI
ncbi:membrane protein [Geobacillus genomosp. 3]|uniref:Membrane protein n=1 Tax=Geobacillus genomosp. 3 TaxID=1921421 RepID=S5Z1A0_GEOG3|nr:NfeD family protein [Geobacillus genomosp. 3]AGT30737.1 membrane protein [Geobacillus genomosp. 3]